MPIIDVTYGPQMEDEQLLQLAKTLPHAVSLAVECPEEPRSVGVYLSMPVAAWSQGG